MVSIGHDQHLGKMSMLLFIYPYLSIRHFSFSPDGKYVAAGSTGDFSLSDISW